MTITKTTLNGRIIQRHDLLNADFTPNKQGCLVLADLLLANMEAVNPIANSVNSFTIPNVIKTHTNI